MINELDIYKLSQILPNPENAEQVELSLKQQIKQQGANVANHSINQIGDEIWRKAIPKIQTDSPELFMLSGESDFFQNRHLLWGEVDPFKQAFGKVFTTYRELMHSNALLERFPPINKHKKKFLNDVEFEIEHGTPPWAFVNQILEECNLDFRVDNPPLSEQGSYEPKLHKISTKIEMRFDALSSGEKVLMSFALCIYNSQDSRQKKIFPKLLLLDEVDAPLHPSMSDSLLKTIQNVLVRDKNVAVILTTHSPSTVALAPPESIYAMNPLGPKIEKVTKSYAVGLLTAGVPTLSISFEGRRQVFVESATDAYLYDSLYQKYKHQLESERSLTFIEVGSKNENGIEQNSGCSQVKSIVDNLVNGGNNSTLGLIDWDGNKGVVESNRIHILSKGIRDGLESLLFDPVLLITLVAKENAKFAKEKKIFDADESYTNIITWDLVRWQRAVDTIQILVLQLTDIGTECIEVVYLNGMSLKVAKAYLHLDDHQLEKKITSTFGFLVPKNSRAGALMCHIVDSVLADYPMLLPRDLMDTFHELLRIDLH